MNKFILILLLCGVIFGQDSNVLRGKVLAQDGIPLPSVNVFLNSTGTATDDKGEFVFTGVRKGVYTLQFTMVGFEEKILPDFNIYSDTNLTVILREKAILIDGVIVSAAKYEQNLSELPVSAAIMQSRELERKNFVSLDEALRYIPGVSMTLDQLSIRGSSGYSRGAGTRVLVALDGIPMYTGDSGEIIWEVFPMPEISRIEVIKGAASSLYGSSAIGGVVNVLTKAPGKTPLTFIRSYAGVYDNPSNEAWKWSDNTRIYNGITVGHSNTSGNFGYSLSLTRTEDMGYKQGEWKKRYAGYSKLAYSFDENTNLSLLINGYLQDKGTFNFWKNLNNALVPPDADQGQRIPSERILSGLKFNTALSEKVNFTNRLSFYHSFWKDGSESLNASNSKQVREEMQFDYQANDNFLLITGFELNFATVKSNIFGENDARGFGIYLHSDYKYTPVITFTSGVRYDYNKRKGLASESAISPKAGINFKLTPNLVTRFFFGTGFRAPSVAETFTSTTTSGLTIRPNLNLKSEKNYSVEAGLNYGVFDNLEVDASLFYNRYFDMIETKLDTSDLTAPYVIFDNVTNAQIMGLDLTGVYNPGDFYIKLGYTYLSSRDIDIEKALKYRPKHLIYISCTYTYDIYEAGIDFRYSSKVDEIDSELVNFGFVADGERRVEIRTFDFRASASLFRYNLPVKIGLNIYNLFNYNYVEMIGNISPIRNISLNLDLLM